MNISNKQQFIFKYLNTILSLRRQYFLLELEEVLETASATEILIIESQKKALAQEIIRFILNPNIFLDLNDQNYINEILKNE